MERARKVEAEVYAKRGIAEGTARRLSDKDLLEMRDRLIEQNKGPKRSLRVALTYKPKTYGSGAMRERLIREYAQHKISRETRKKYAGWQDKTLSSAFQYTCPSGGK